MTNFCDELLRQTAVMNCCNSLSLMLRPTFSQPVCLGIKHPSGLTTRYLLVFDNYGPVFVGVLSDVRAGLSFVYAAGTRQCSLSWVRVPLDS
jgi:hypothetical protein